MVTLEAVPSDHVTELVAQQRFEPFLVDAADSVVKVMLRRARDYRVDFDHLRDLDLLLIVVGDRSRLLLDDFAEQEALLEMDEFKFRILG